jgi:hypothetical protein
MRSTVILVERKLLLMRCLYQRCRRESVYVVLSDLESDIALYKKSRQEQAAKARSHYVKKEWCWECIFGKGFQQSSTLTLNRSVQSPPHHISDYAYENELHINCEGDNIAEFLKEKLQNVSKKKKRKLCLTIAEFCGRVRIRRLRNVHGRDRSGNTKGLRE